jgi:membrane protein YqaA with SNARE-associated domain
MSHVLEWLNMALVVFCMLGVLGMFGYFALLVWAVLGARPHE